MVCFEGIMLKTSIGSSGNSIPFYGLGPGSPFYESNHPFNPLNVRIERIASCAFAPPAVEPFAMRLKEERIEFPKIEIQQIEIPKFELKVDNYFKEIEFKMFRVREHSIEALFFRQKEEKFSFKLKMPWE